MYDFEHILSPENVNPGLSDSVFIAPVSFFADIKEPEDNGWTKRTRISIEDSHSFLERKGFLENITKPFSAQFSYQDKQSKLDVILLGNYEDLHASVAILEGVPLIVLCRDMHCDGLVHQLGTFDFPAYIQSSYKSSTGRSGSDKGYTISFTSYYHTPILYKGGIEILDTLPKFFISESGIPFITESGASFTT